MNAAFWMLSAFLALLASCFVAWPLLRRPVAADPAGEMEARRVQNLEAYRIEREELERSHASGALAEADYRALLLEIERRLLQDAESQGAHVANRAPGAGRRLLLGMALALPLLAFVGYRELGASGAEQLDGLLGRLEQTQDEKSREELLVQVLPLLEAEARRKDEDGAYRFLLARVYTGEKRYPEAASTYAEVAAIYPEDSAILAQYAQALYMAGGRRITPAVQELIDRALAIDPAQLTLLGLLGMDRFQSGNFAGAVEAWEKLLANLPPDAPDATVIREGVEAARARLAANGTPLPAHAAAPAGPEVSASASASAPRLEVHVELAPDVQAAPGTTVFVFAKALSGPPMPLAVARFPVSELPKTVILDDSMAMAPGLRLSGFPEVRVVARVSSSGGPIAQPGDFEGDAGPVRTSGGAQQVAVRIDRRL